MNVILMFLIGCALDVLRAVVVQYQWNWFITPWANIIAPGVMTIWGLFILKSLILNHSRFEHEKSISDVVIEDLSLTVTVAILGWLIHLFV